MASIKSIIINRGGRAGHWRVTEDEGTFVLFHYATPMLRWQDSTYRAIPIDWSVGHGSVSDQGGMNQAFRLLNIPLRYTRKGGADIS